MTCGAQNVHEFLEYVRAKLSKPIGFDPNPDTAFIDLTKQELAESGMLGKYTMEQFRQYQPVVDQLRDVVCRYLNAQQRDILGRTVAIGALDTGDLNAMILRSPCGLIAVVLNSGLILLLNKYFKYQHARFRPEAVSYCEGQQQRSLTSEDYTRYLTDMIERCRRGGSPGGPRIKICDSEKMSYYMNVNFAQVFILCHELAHLFNGDLSETDRLSAFRFENVLLFDENNNHEMEHNADIAGFDLMKRAIMGEMPGYPQKLVMAPIYLLFQIFEILFGGATWSHPDPLERILRIAEHHYGQDFADDLRRAYDDPDFSYEAFSG